MWSDKTPSEISDFLEKEWYDNDDSMEDAVFHTLLSAYINGYINLGPRGKLWFHLLGGAHARAKSLSLHVGTDMHTSQRNPLNKWRKQARF